jgi:hypothetical protein
MPNPQRIRPCGAWRERWESFWCDRRTRWLIGANPFTIDPFLQPPLRRHPLALCQVHRSLTRIAVHGDNFEELLGIARGGSPQCVRWTIRLNGQVCADGRLRL